MTLIVTLLVFSSFAQGLGTKEKDEKLKAAALYQKKAVEIMEGRAVGDVQVLFRKAFEIRKELLPHDNRNYFESLEGLARTTDETKEKILLYEEAEPLALSLFKGAEGKERSADIALALSELYREIDQNEKAENALRRYIEGKGGDYKWFKETNERAAALNAKTAAIVEPYARQAEEEGKKRQDEMMQRLMKNFPTNAIKPIAPPKTWPGNSIELENTIRAQMEQMATQNPEVLSALTKMGLPLIEKHKAHHTIKDFDGEWNHWNGSFEIGESPSMLVGFKGHQIGIFPEKNPPTSETVAKFVINLKGLLLTRELRLQKSLSDIGASAEGKELRRLLWEKQSEQAKNLSNPSASGLLPKEVAQFFASVPDKKEAEIRALAVAHPGNERPRVLEPAEIVNQLPKKTSLVVFFEHGLDSGGLTQVSSWYGALVVSSEGTLNWVEVGKKEEITEVVNRYAALGRGTITASASEVEAIVDDISKRIWSKVEPFIPPSTTDVFVSPEGVLYGVSFATLRRGNQFLCEKYRIRYTISPRELLTEKDSGPHEGRIDVLSSPDYDIGLPVVAEDHSFLGWVRSQFKEGQSQASSFGEKRFTPLPGALKETRFLLDTATSFGRTNIEIKVGKNATEAALAKVSSPNILHIATHAFYEEPTVNTKGINPIPFVPQFLEPLYRNGLVLAGANSTLKNWMSQKLPAAAEDGVVSATELSRLNLKGTWISSLSACDTGVGTTISGEGLLALQLGLFEAGSRNVVYTLWPVYDEAAPRLFAAFYKRAFETKNAGRSMAEAQKEAIVAIASEKSPDSLLKSIRFAGPFVLSERGVSE